MNDAWLGRLFLRFRDRRDGKALAAVFDATARELIGVATHLVPSLDQAEDVVQTTFQRAIEHADRFDGERSLKGWLYGILWREAAKLVRSERRAPERDALVARASREPADEVGADELPAAVRAALAHVPPPYREVLEPVLCDERSTREVARELGRSPGTVRVQLQRGLERLRRELPSALRQGAAPRASHALGLAALRERVLAHAGHAGATVPAASLAFLAWQLASVALTPPALLAAAALAAAGGVGVAQLGRSAPSAGGSATSAVEPTEESAPPRDAPTELETAEIPPEAPATDVTPASPARAPREGSRPARAQDIERPQVTGIVLDTLRQPLAGLTVEAEAENHYGYESTTTDADGRFALSGLAAGRWYVHVDDPRYARMWWQTHGVGIEEDGGEALEAELEIVLSAPHAVAGVVVDEHGAPVAAKVTLAAEHLEGAQGPVQGHLTSEIASVECDEQGLFRLERLRRGEMTVVLDHPGFARTLARFQVPGAPPRLVIESGLVLEGEVVQEGRLLAGASVHASSTRQARLTMGDWELETDERGRFRIEHVHPVGESRLHGVPTLTVTVEDERWISDWHRVFESAQASLPFVRIEARERSGAGQRSGVDVGRDHEGEARRLGKPFGTGAIRVRAPGDGLVERIQLRLSGLSGELAKVSENGTIDSPAGHVFEHLAPGRYRIAPVSASGPNYAPAELELGPDERREVVLTTGELVLRGRILCAGEPVPSARVRARSIRDGSGQNATGVTSADGAYEVAGLLPGSYELVVSDTGALVQSFEVRLEADMSLDLELPPGRIEGRVAGLDLAALGEGFRVMVFPYGWYQEAGNRGVFVAPDAQGRFSVRHLAPGAYAVSAWRAPELVTSRVVTLRAGERAAQVVLAPAAERGTIAGRITSPGGVRGRPSIAVLRREPEGLRRTAYCEVGPDGAFAEEVEPGPHALLVSDFEGELPFVLVPDVLVRAGERTELALALPASREVSIRLDAAGAWTPRSIWQLVHPGGERLSYLLFIGSEAEGRRAGTRVFRLPHGSYTIEADFGDALPSVHELTVAPGDGVQEVVVNRR